MSSQVIGTVDVSALTGKDTIVINQGWVRFYNHSIFGLNVTLSDGQAFYIPPQSRRTICVVQPSGDFTWEQILQMAVSPGATISNLMVIETLDDADTKIENDVTLMGGVQNIGNPTPVSINATSVAHDSTTIDEFIEASLNGNKNWSAKNDGSLAVTPASNGGVAAAFQIVAGGALGVFALVKLDNGQIATDGQGNLTIAGNHLLFTRPLNGFTRQYILFQPSDGATQWALQEVVGGDLAIFDNTHSSTRLRFLTAGGMQFDAGLAAIDGSGNFSAVTLAAEQALGGVTKSFLDLNASDLPQLWRLLIDASGNLFVNDSTHTRNPLILPPNLTQSLQGWSVFSGTGSGTFAHGLSVAPDIVLPMQSVVGSQTMGYDSVTATNVHITAGAGNAWHALALVCH